MSVISKTLCILLLINLSVNLLLAGPRLVRYSFTINNESRDFINEAKFFAAAPQKDGELVTNHPCEKTGDYVGNRLLTFKLANIPPRGTEIITISAKVNTSQIKTDKPLKEFLEPQEKIESNAKEIAQKAKELKRKK